MHEIRTSHEPLGHREEVEAALLGDQPAGVQHDRTRSGMLLTCRARIMLDVDSVAEIASLPRRTHTIPTQHIDVLGALHQHLVGPVAAPPFEGPTSEIAEPTVVAVIQRTMHRVDRAVPGQAGGGQRQHRGLRRVGLDERESVAAKEPIELTQ